MTVFDSYGRYYDLLYRDKDYAGEAQFLQQRFQEFGAGTQSILELGCGTGQLAALLAGAGYRVHGVDLSEEMLKRAATRRDQLPPDTAGKLSFSPANVQSVRLEQTFDAVISIFHVVSYQTTEAALRGTFESVKAHLKPGGVFIFDVWYGPAVLTHRPEVRVKRLENEHIAVTRIAEPVLYPEQNCVDVNYQIFVQDKSSQLIETLSETHRMRYFFTPELEKMLTEAGLDLVCCREWMSNSAPSFDTWGVYFVGHAQDLTARI